MYYYGTALDLPLMTIHMQRSGSQATYNVARRDRYIQSAG